MLMERTKSGQEDPVAGFRECRTLFPEGLFDAGHGKPAAGWEEASGKFTVLLRLLERLRRETSDRAVVVSNFTQTLDLIAEMCNSKNWPVVRLDGNTTAKKRKRMVTEFNDPQAKQFVFLLSSKAGGCGLNLIGGNRLILFDPDWNPATDKQAAARVWRDGQKKRVYIYRFLATGTLEERIFQRQLSKEGLQVRRPFNSRLRRRSCRDCCACRNGSQGMVDSGGQLDSSLMSQDELSQLFHLQSTTSDTHDSLKCDRCADGGCSQHKEAAEDDLATWSHHPSCRTLPDRELAESAGDVVSFAFSLRVGDGC